MSSRNMKLDEIKARAQAAFEKTEQRRKEALVAWQAVEDEASAARLKTEKLRALRLADVRHAVQGDTFPAGGGQKQ